MIPCEFRTAIMAARQAIQNRQASEEKRQRDSYASRMQAALRKINRPDYPAGMVPWLGEHHPDLYDELTARLPDLIHRFWEARAPLAEFDAILVRLVQTHQRACELYRQHIQKGSQRILEHSQGTEQAR